jgi:hypothetical protein
LKKKKKNRKIITNLTIDLMCIKDLLKIKNRWMLFKRVQAPNPTTINNSTAMKNLRRSKIKISLQLLMREMVKSNNQTTRIIY